MDSLVSLLQRPPSRDAWLAIIGWLMAHPSGEQADEAAQLVERALVTWPDTLRRIDVHSYLWELFRGDPARSYWRLGKAVAAEVPLLADQRFSSIGLRVLESVPALIVEWGSRARREYSAAVVSRVLGRVPRVRQLVLGDSPVGARGLRSFLAVAPTLSTLDLSRCALRSGSLEGILALPSAARLATLDVSGNHLSQSDVVALARSPAANVLEVLEFSGNSLAGSGRGYPDLRMPQLRTLGLSACGLLLVGEGPGLAGWELPKLEALDVSLQPLCTEDLQLLAAWLPGGVQRLSLRGCGLGSNELGGLAEVVAARPTATFDLRDNPLSGSHIDQLQAHAPTATLVCDAV